MDPYRSQSLPIRTVTIFRRIERVHSEQWVPVRLTRVRSLPIIISQSHVQYRSRSQLTQESEQQDSMIMSEIGVQKQALQTQLAAKQQELDVMKNKLKRMEEMILDSKEFRKIIEKQQEIIKEWETKYMEQEKAHNIEIVQLKCNLDNSIFDEQPEQSNDGGLGIIHEENENQQNKSITQSDDIDMPLLPIQQTILALLKQVDIDDEQQLDMHNVDQFIIGKIKQIVEYIAKTDAEMDDWKRNYWVLDKKHNQLLLQTENPSYQRNIGSQEIEIEFDFEKKQFKQTQIAQPTQPTKQSQYQSETSDRKASEKEIKELKQTISELKKTITDLQGRIDQNIQFTETNRKGINKQTLQQLMQKPKLVKQPPQLTQVNEPCNTIKPKLSMHQQQTQQTQQTQQQNNKKQQQSYQQIQQLQLPREIHYNGGSAIRRSNQRQFITEGSPKSIPMDQHSSYMNPQQARNHYFSHYFQQQQRVSSNRQSPLSVSPQQVQFNKVNMTQFPNDYSMDKFYSYTPNVYSTPVIVKQVSLSPYSKTSKYLQF